jgi:hypothetical protein
MNGMNILKGVPNNNIRVGLGSNVPPSPYFIIYLFLPSLVLICQASFAFPL